MSPLWPYTSTFCQSDQRGKALDHRDQFNLQVVSEQQTPAQDEHCRHQLHLVFGVANMLLYACLILVLFYNSVINYLLFHQVINAGRTKSEFVSHP